MNSEQFELWKLTSSQTSQRHNFFSCFNSIILTSNRTVLFVCSPPPLHPKLGLTNLIVNSLFTHNPNLEEQIADKLGIVRKEYHGKLLEGWQCSKLLPCSAFLKEVVPPSRFRKTLHGARPIAGHELITFLWTWWFEHVISLLVMWMKYVKSPVQCDSRLRRTTPKLIAFPLPLIFAMLLTTFLCCYDKQSY